MKPSLALAMNREASHFKDHVASIVREVCQSLVNPQDFAQLLRAQMRHQ